MSETRPSSPASGLFALLAHDLRTPLSLIHGYAQLLMQDATGRRKDHTTEYLSAILAHADVLAHLIKDLALLDQIQRHGLQVTPEPIELNQLLAAAVRDLEPLIAEKGLQVDLQLSSPHSSVAAAEDLLGHALYNVISYAVRHAPAGGVLSVGLAEAGGSSEIEIVDPARTLTPDDCRDLFELPADTQPQEPAASSGAGIGLYIASQIVAAHDGSADVDCSPGGRRLLIRLPLPES